MVALKAELGAAQAYVPGRGIPPRLVYVAGGADALPGTGQSLGTFEHYSSTDPFHKHGPNHVAFHHVRDLLYKRIAGTGAAGTHPFWPYNMTDLQNIQITRHGAILNATGITAVPVTMVVAATATLAVKLQPGSVASAAADNDFQTANPAVATVAATGVVTGVAPGNTVIRIVNKFNGHRTEANVTVTAAVLLLEGQSEEEDEENLKAQKEAVDKAIRDKEAEDEDNKKKSKK